VGFSGTQTNINSPQRMGKALLLFETDIQILNVKQILVSFPGQ
jgi:hypothetical protein